MDELEDQLNIVNRYIRNAIKTGVIPIPEAMVLDEAWRGIQCRLDELKLQPDLSRNEPVYEDDKTYFTAHSLFMNQAPSFNFELDADAIVKRALEYGFVTKVGEDKYLFNESYGDDSDVD